MENSEKLQTLSKALRHANTTIVEKCIIELIEEYIQVLVRYDIPFEDAWDTWQKKAHHKRYS